MYIALISNIMSSFWFITSDIDECLEAALSNKLLCNDSEICQNTLGGYYCGCPPGTEYSNTNQKCEVPGK